jgi:hypothetical protein
VTSTRGLQHGDRRSGVVSVKTERSIHALTRPGI